MRLALFRYFVPQAAIAAADEDLNERWRAFCAVWNPDERRAWKDAERAETLDANLIERGCHGGYAASTGSDES